LGTSQSLYEGFAFTELSWEVLQKGGGFNFRALSLIGRSISTRLTVSTTRKSSIAARVVLLLPKAPFGRKRPHCTPIAKQRRHCAESINQEEQRRNTYILKENKMFQLE
jgi:hypothetical protein